jgi:RHS repeat-associated protein
MVTCTMTMVLSDATDASSVQKNKLYSSVYYDKYGQVLRTISDNHLGGRDVVTNLYEDITFLVTQTKQEHYNGSEQITLEKWFEYDHAGRLLATREKVNGQPEITLNAMKYNEVGEMITKYLHSNQTIGNRSFVQKTDYQYNIRGWLTKINDPGLGNDNDMFGMQLFYNDITEMGSTIAPPSGLFNGNIVGMKWGIKNETIRGYQFSYDGLNRLSQANYAEGASLGTNAGYFSENITNYDKNGNILGLQRKYNNILVDGLAYTYITKTNQLQRVTDSGTSSPAVDDYPGNSLDYIYDLNGNMIYDGAKNFNINYHRTINLPQQLDFGGNNRIFYHYTAGGTKLIKHTVPGTGTGTLTHYIGNIVYEGGTLSYIITEEGRLVPTGTGDDRKFLYEYNEKDHLGNNRVTFMGTDLGGAIDIVQTTSYYPFGLVMNQYNGNIAPGYQKNKYLYNGKELQDDKMTSEALNWNDYGARFYDPQIGRFNSIDLLTDLHSDYTPYAYCYNNPVKLIDPFGLDSTYYNLNGVELNKATGDKGSTDVVFITRTPATTEQLYGAAEYDEKGKTNPITQEQYEHAIIDVVGGNFDKLDGLVAQIKSHDQIGAAISSIKDDSNGGGSGNNNREYGGNFSATGVNNVVEGPVGTLGSGKNVTIPKREYHSHPSGTSSTRQWIQPPSATDIKYSGNQGYVFSMRTKMIYVYNSSGVIATIPISTFKK